MLNVLIRQSAVASKSAGKVFAVSIFFISAISCLCYLARAANLDMFTRVESCFSECSREMLQCHNFITPLYEGKEFFDKPILTYWLIAFCYKFFGISVFAARLPSVFSALGAIVLSAYFAKKNYGAFVGVLTALILSSCTGFAEMASTAMSDMLLCLFDLLTLITLFLGFEKEEHRTRLFCIASASMAFGFLTKSLIAIIFPVAAFIAFLVLYKKINIIKPKHLLFGIGIFLIITLPWHIALYKDSGLNALNWMYLHEQVSRFSSNIVEYNFGHPFYYMSLSLLSQLLPWSVFLPIVIWKMAKAIKLSFNNTKTQCTVFLLIFVLLHLVTFTISKSNWGYYNLPALTAASILMAKYLMDSLDTVKGNYQKYCFILPFAVFIATSIFSLVYSLFVLPVKMRTEAPHKFAEIIMSKNPKNRLVVSTDLFGQYFLCSWLPFRTGQMLHYCYQRDLISAIGEKKATWFVLPKIQFDRLPEWSKNRLQILATERYRFIPFPLSPLKTEVDNDCKVSLVLATNQQNADRDYSYDEFEAGIQRERAAFATASSNDKVHVNSLENAFQSNEAHMQSWWLAKDYCAYSKTPDVVILGDSQLGALFGADTYVFGKSVDVTGGHHSAVIEHDLDNLLGKKWKVFVCALPGAMVSDQLVISRALFSEQHRPQLVVLGISPRAFIDNCFESPLSTEAFSFFAKYDDSDKLRNSWFSPKNATGISGSTFNYYSEKNSPLTLGEPFEHIRPNEIKIGLGDGYVFSENTEEYRQRYKDPLSSRFVMQMRCFDSLLGYLARHKIRAVVFDLPITAANKNLLLHEFWNTYTDKIIEICKKNAADFVDINNDWRAFNDQDFVDSVHLNLPGSLKLTRPVALFTANKFRHLSAEELQKPRGIF